MVKEQIKQQLPQLHLIRALASLGVTIFHLGGKKLFILNYGWLGVEMFFVLTGFIICWSLPNDYSYQYLPKFLLKRFVRIGPPYVISIIIVILVSVIVEPLIKEYF